MSILSPRGAAPARERRCGVVDLPAGGLGAAPRQQTERTDRLLQDLLRTQVPLRQRGHRGGDQEPSRHRVRPGRTAQVDGLQDLDAGGDERRRWTQEQSDRRPNRRRR